MGGEEWWGGVRVFRDARGVSVTGAKYTSFGYATAGRLQTKR